MLPQEVLKRYLVGCQIGSYQVQTCAGVLVKEF